MASSALDDKSRMPDDSVLADVLGKSKAWWDAVHAYLEEKCPGVQDEWRFTSPKYGWTFRARHKKRTILYMIPQRGSFRISFALGPKAVAAAEESSLSASVLEAIRAARVYAEGRGVSVEVQRRVDVEDIRKLIEIKVTH